MALERRPLRFNEWEEVLADIEDLRSRGYDHAAHGVWSLGQITEHLAIVLSGAVDGYPKLLPLPMRMLIRFLFLKKMLDHVPSKVKASAPQSLQPPEECSDDEGIEKLKTAIDRFRSQDGEYQTHLALGKLTADQWKHQQLWHCEHHLSFLIPKEDAA